MAALSRCISAQPTLSRILRWNRSYASAAAAQLDYDFYTDDEDEHRKEWNCPVAEESESWVSGGGVQWVIIGDPMAKRHVYAERLSKLLNVPHISMGTLVRQELNPHSSLYKEIASAVNKGRLVPEHVIFGLLSKRLEEGCYSGKSGFILDGLPRTRIQAEILDEITDIDLVINLKSTEFLAKTDVGMRILSPSREFFRMGRSRFNLTLQSQDRHLNSSFNSDNAWKEKLRLHYEQIKPLEEYYRKQNKLLDFTVSRAPGDTWQGLIAALHLQHINAASSSQKLSA